MKKQKSLTLLVAIMGLLSSAHAYSGFSGKGEDSTVSNITLGNETELAVPDWWIAADPEYSDWVNYGDPIYTSNWSPAISTQTSNFTQSRNYNQTMIRTIYIREQNLAYMEMYRVVTTESESKIFSGTESRTISVTNSGWVNSGSAYGCSSWSPSTGSYNSGVAFTQTRSCSQKQVKTWSYKVGTTLISTRSESRVISTSGSRSATGTKKSNTGKLVYLADYRTYKGEADYELSLAEDDGYTVVNTSKSAYLSQGGKSCTPIGSKYTYWALSGSQAYYADYVCK